MSQQSDLWKHISFGVFYTLTNVALSARVIEKSNWKENYRRHKSWLLEKWKLGCYWNKISFCRMNIFLDTCHTQHKSIFICVKNTHTRLNTSNYPFTLISMFDHIKFMKVSEQVDQSCNGSPELFILVILYFKDVNELLFFFHCKWMV